MSATTLATTWSEDQLLAWTLNTARMYGWRTLHIRPARTATGWRTAVQGDGTGWPDVFAVRGDRAIAAELKKGRARLRPEQEAWIAALTGVAGIDTYIWRTTTPLEEIAGALR